MEKALIFFWVGAAKLGTFMELMTWQRTLVAVAALSIGFLQFSAKKVKFHSGPDSAGKTERQVVLSLIDIEMAMKGNVAKHMSTRVKSEFKSLPGIEIETDAQLAKFYSLILPKVKGRKSKDRRKSRPTKNDLATIVLTDYVLVFEKKCVRNWFSRIKNHELADIPTEYRDELYGHAFVQEDGVWKYDGEYNLNGKRISLLDHADDWQNLTSYASRAKN